MLLCENSDERIGEGGEVRLGEVVAAIESHLQFVIELVEVTQVESSVQRPTTDTKNTRLTSDNL